MIDSYIAECISAHANVVVYTMNGFQMRGCIVAEFSEYIVLKSSGKKKMIYKHAISTIERE